MSKKPDWLFKQSGVIPYLWKGDDIQIVLVTSTSRNGWVLPKGVIERSMSPEDSAAKEAFEEAGAIGNVGKDIVAEYEYEKWGGTCHVKMYPMEVTKLLKSWQEKDKRERRVVNIRKALDMIKPKHRQAIVEFKNLAL
jgi:8-oxo-dGTP pyrophosphatase MutT (NUDIX family)